MAVVERRGSVTLYFSESVLLLPPLHHPKLKVLRTRWNWIESIGFDYSVESKCELCLGEAVENGEVMAEEKRIDARCCELRLPCLGFQHAEYLFLYQKSIPLLKAPKINRIWFRGLRVFEKEPMASYYPVLFRERPHGRFTKWRVGWTHDHDDHTHNDRIAFARR